MTSEYITATAVSQGLRKLQRSNGVLLGDAVLLEDGYFYFFMDASRGGACSAHLLREIADCLDGMNEEWDKMIKQELKP